MSFTGRWLRYSDILPIIEKLKENSIFTIERAGNSAEKREIYLISAGQGKTKVLFWSQMHGDESTATMAIFDILNFLKSDDEFNSIRKKILNETTLYFIPMLNPDGAENFQRRNAQDIDINRDALRLQTPEAKILSGMVEKLKPEFGFNLHDQSPRYSAGRSFKSAAISFLAPPYDEEKSINETRLKSIKLICRINQILSHFIPGHTSRYKDNFDPRAFGDNIQKRGTSTILIETGTWKEDIFKQYLRKLNFVTLLVSINTICCETFNEENINDYFAIPENEELLFDLIIRNVTMKNNYPPLNVDIGINLYETVESNIVRYKGLIEDIGDLSGYFGYDEIDCTDMTAEPGITYPDKLNTIDEIGDLNLKELYINGVTSVVVSDKNYNSDFVDYPIIVYCNENKLIQIKTGHPAQLILKKDDVIRYILVNGFLYDIETATNNIRNGIIIK
jgi:hypothetical protein